MTGVVARGVAVPDLPATFWALVVDAARRHGDRVAFEDGYGAAMTFLEYRTASERVAAGLHELGVDGTCTVSWMLPTTIDAVVVMGALARLGARQNPMITSLGGGEIRFITREAGSELLLHPRSWRGVDVGALVAPIAAEVGFRPVVADELPAGDPAILPPPPATGTRRSWLYHTSGSTAVPKGVWHSDVTVMHGSNTPLHATEPVADDVNPTAFPIGHIGGAVKVAGALRVGYRLLLVDQWDPDRTPYVMAERGCTTLGTALPFFVAFLAAQRAHGDQPLWPRLRACISGGAPKPPGLHAEVRAVLGGAGVLGSWGLTEFPIATSASPGDPDDMLDRTEGRPGPGVEVKVVARDGRLCGELEEGELRLRGPQRFLGYANPQLDADGIDEEGFVRTGDLGVVHPGGYVQITGRVKDVIIRNAENISASEVEACIAEIPGVTDVAVVGIPDPRTGERAVAVVSGVDHGAPLTLGVIADHCLARGLAKWKIPEQVELVDDLPRTAMGKIDKAELRAWLTG